jgi:hypothetical protein
METKNFITSFFGNGKRSVPKVATEAKPRDVGSNYTAEYTIKPNII